MLKILKYLIPLYIGAALGPLGGFGVVTLLSGIIEVRQGWPFFFYFLAALSLIAGKLYLISSSPAGQRKEPGGAIAN